VLFSLSELHHVRSLSLNKLVISELHLLASQPEPTIPSESAELYYNPLGCESLTTSHRWSLVGMSQEEDLCVECSDTVADVNCPACAEVYCALCFSALHRRGKRSEHSGVSLNYPPRKKHHQIDSSPAPLYPSDPGFIGPPLPPHLDLARKESLPPAAAAAAAAAAAVKIPLDPQTAATLATQAGQVPLRFNTEERKKLEVLLGALEVSEYTDKVSCARYGQRDAVIISELKKVFESVLGLWHVAQGGGCCPNSMGDCGFISTVLEVGCRHKIMNPDSMRSNFGKLLWMMQDATAPHAKERLGVSIAPFNCTVANLVEQVGCQDLLRDEDLLQAVTHARDKGAAGVKHAARARLLETHGLKEPAREEAIMRIIHSIDDASSHTHAAQLSASRLLEMLSKYWGPAAGGKPAGSLAIRSGHGGARLTHTHSQQEVFVRQSLLLWREALGYLPSFWKASVSDVLSASGGYSIQNTGQGMHRVQNAPQVGQLMASCVRQVELMTPESWVGSTVIHLGDHCVPNPLVFIDKLVQIPRILDPIISVLDYIDSLDLPTGDARVLRYVDGFADDIKKLAWGGHWIRDPPVSSPQIVKSEILRDFFRHSFDGSGARNFYDAGSCIDGRLTSTWNWCSKIEKKWFYGIFLLAGFQGFDGSFE
jgi:hypothetical protein